MAQQFENELKKLQKNFMNMGINVSEQIYQAAKSFTDHDKDLAEQVIAGDKSINKAEINLEKQALYMMALQQPVATDFREIISILKASYDLERVGDQAVGIAQETIYIKGNTRLPEVEQEITELTGKVRKMLEETLDAYFHDDAALARKVANEDKTIDDAFIAIRENLTDLVDQETSTAAASYLMVARHLERIGDHIVNITEWIIYSNTGEIVELNDDAEERALFNKSSKHN